MSSFRLVYTTGYACNASDFKFRPGHACGEHARLTVELADNAPERGIKKNGERRKGATGDAINSTCLIV